MFKIIKKLLDIDTPDWMAYKPETEMQTKFGLKTQACVSHSILNGLEMQFNYLIKNKKIIGEELEWLESHGYLLRDKVQFSKRYIAKMSNTSEEGNWGNRVMETVLKYGLVPESIYGWEDKDINEWNEYYQDVPEYIQKAGEEFLYKFDISYRWERDFKTELKQSPMAIGVYAWKKKNGLYYRPKGKLNNHFVVLYKI